MFGKVTEEVVVLIWDKKNMQSIVLDPDSEGVPPGGYLAVDSEIEFLRLATTAQRLYIRGPRLCAWAQTFFDGRNLPYSEACSPPKRLRENFPGLTSEDAGYICHSLGENTSALENFSAQEVLNVCFPSQIWSALPSSQHAAQWLLWLDREKPDPAFGPLLEAVSKDWKQACPEMSEVYEATDGPTARELLLKWLGAKSVPAQTLGLFPIPVPDELFHDLEKQWRKQIVQSKGEFLGQFMASKSDLRSKQAVAVATLEYFEHHSDSEILTDQMFEQMRRFFSGEEMGRLCKLKRPLLPTAVPDDPELVVKWFCQEYLPFREWQYLTHSEQMYPEILQIGREFAKWYLDYYPKALISKQWLSFFRSKALQEQDPTHVNLLVILDGLQAIDAQSVRQSLLQSTGPHHLTLIEESYCFAPLPTVTDFAQGALVHGVQPAFMKDFATLGDIVPELQTPLPKLRNSRPGDLLIWRIQEPDRTYHTENMSPMLNERVKGELSKIAREIIAIEGDLPEDMPLRIIITTDHGRFLGPCKRSVEVPPNMRAHGRAAWGKTEISYDRSGYKIEGDLVFLSKDRFGLSAEDAAVILSDCAFRNDVYDCEISPHGGLFPEEVVIPWMVFERFVEPPDLEIHISGDGQANRKGRVLVSITNPSPMDVTVTKVEINLGGANLFSYDLSQAVRGLDAGQFELELPAWPSSEQLATGRALVVACMPDGQEITFQLTLTDLKVAEMYTRNKSFLEGLDL